jgi:general secretion pathway protein D
VNTVLRLKDGQTEILGGLIQDQDRASATRLPGLGDIPILGRLFGIQSDTKNKKEIILSITPRIVRSNNQAESDLLEMWSGTENNFRFGTRMVGSPTPAAVPAVVSSPTGAPALAIAAAPTTPRMQAGRSPTAVPVSVPAIPSDAATPRPLILKVVPVAKPGDKITVDLALPPLSRASNLEAKLSFDPERLRLLTVNEADAARNAAAAVRFTGDLDGQGAVKLELTAGRGESLPLGGGALAQLVFEVMPGSGKTSVRIDATQLRGDAETKSLPTAAPAEVDIKASP